MPIINIPNPSSSPGYISTYVQVNESSDDFCCRLLFDRKVSNQPYTPKSSRNAYTPTAYEKRVSDNEKRRIAECQLRDAKYPKLEKERDKARSVFLKTDVGRTAMAKRDADIAAGKVLCTNTGEYYNTVGRKVPSYTPAYPPVLNSYHSYKNALIADIAAGNIWRAEKINRPSTEPGLYTPAGKHIEFWGPNSAYIPNSHYNPKCDYIDKHNFHPEEDECCEGCTIL